MPPPNPARLYRHVERYLVGSCNEAALENWRLAVGGALARGVALDALLDCMARLYLKALKHEAH